MTEQNLVQMFVNRAERYGTKTALLAKQQGRYREISWHDFSSSVRRFALGLAYLGVQPGDRVCLLSENRPEWAYADLAILSLGAVNVPVYPTSSLMDVEYIVNHSEAHILIVSTSDQFARVNAVASNCPRLKWIVVMDSVTAADERVIGFDAVSEKGRKREAQHPTFFDESVRKVRPEDLATIIYTSGTTGQPKGVMLTHHNFLSNIEVSARALPATEEDRCLSFLPLSHIFERMAGFYFMIYQGVSIAYAENMDTVPKNLLEIQPTVAASVPRLYEKMYARVLEQVHAGGRLKVKIFNWSLAVGKASAPYRMRRAPMPFGLRCQYELAKRLVFGKLKAKLGGRLRFFISGGAALSREIAEFFYAADLLILEGYGLTETSPVVTVNRPERFKFGTVGLPVEGVEVKIAGDGEILVKGPNVMKGYFRNDEETREVLREDWFYTGDIGELDEEGFLKITDRKKDLFKTSGGKYIAPQKIENLLVADEYIAQVCVLGDARRYATALIVPDFQHLEQFARDQGVVSESQQELIRNEKVLELFRTRVDQRTKDLASYEALKCFTLLPEEFTQDKGELTPTLKLKRKVIYEKYRNLIEAMYQDRARAEKTGV